MRPSRVACAALLVTLLSATSARAADPDAGPADFGAQARVLWRTVACGGQDGVPERLPQKAVEAHCKAMQAVYARYREKWADVALPFLAGVRPAQLPTQVVYPFGGGDLLFAMAVFPDATEITSISLERAGDARVIDRISKADFKAGLVDAAYMIVRLAGDKYSFTEHMKDMQESRLPVQLVMALAALAAFGQEPVGLRYFELAADGALRYLAADELDRARAKQGIPAAYANIELTYRPAGQPNAPLRTYRSIAGNLHDSRFTRASSLYKHLAAKGPVAAMTKAASYLMWRDDFSQVREYLLGHMVWMVSDSTGILPAHARKAGFVQETYGAFRGSLLQTDEKKNRTMIQLWRDQPRRPMPVRFGYPDWEKKGGHLLVTRKP